MTDNHPDHPHPTPIQGGRHRAEPVEPGTPCSPSGPDAQHELGERAANNLLHALTTSGQSVRDLDADRTLRVTALSMTLTYRAIDLAGVEAPSVNRADLVVLRWPRPGDPSWLRTASEVFTAVHSLLSPVGQVAVVLDPNPANAFGVTWIGTLLAGAADARLPGLRDIICVHDLEAGHAEQPDASASAMLRHRIILVLAASGGRHVR